MRLTIIPSDNLMILDGRVLKFPFPADVNLHAIQWHDTYGFVEFTSNKQMYIDKMSDVQPFVDAFNAESARLAAIEAMPKPPKTPAEIEIEASNAAKAALNKLRADTYPDVLIFLATLPGAPKLIKDAAIAAAAEKAKIKP